MNKYQQENMALWTRTQMIQFLMNEGMRGPRTALRRRSKEWLMQECVTEGALQCSECGEETSGDNPLLDTGSCEECQEKADDSYHDDATCGCPCHE